MKLGLGTVQFGLPYGISNTSGQVIPDEVRAILDQAEACGIRVLDTAIAYGTSEAVIGVALREKPHGSFRIVSKIPPGSTATEIPDLVRASLTRLGIPRAHGFLLHDVTTHRENPEVLSALWGLVASGLIEKVGFSVYSPDDVEQLLLEQLHFNIIQLPYNIFDRRFERLLPALKERGVEVHVRSVFLQGLFFRDPATLPPHFDTIRPALATLRSLAASASLPLTALPLAFALSQPLVDVVVIGVDSVANLRQNLNVAERLGDLSPLLPRLAALEQRDNNILLPTRWKMS